MRWTAGWTLVPLSTALAAVAGAACGLSSFVCQDDGQCQDGGVAGFCEMGGGCSFPDGDCESGRRFGEHAPGGVGGECVAGDGSETGVGTLGTSTTSSTTATSQDEGNATDGSTTVAASATSDGSEVTDASASASSGSSDGGESSSGGGGSFFDPFDRPSDPALGNGWIEKTAGAFQLLDEQVELEGTNGLNFRDNLFYRPLGESMLDVEVTAVVNFTTDEPRGYPQIHVRVQEDDLLVDGSLTSYAVFVDSADPLAPLLTVNRIAGPDFGPSDSAPIVPVPLDAETYRLRARVTGIDPVVVQGFFEIDTLNGWEIVAEMMLVDTAADRITTPGTVGAGGHLELQYFVLDDFGYTDLGG